ncbi:GAF domain-containing protein [Zunongwangia sp. SCSIO 43204]|uniref:GAF domain-containing protein n=1 Tax=Zunongwangia sp. SCSIO 43204 TaxID=2779359 RepID=UPI001CA90C61|nr:GAF domain-containing protein [Zunongwangia sp. SCSIO 43204]UAB83811.1 GAF domain-containing protein [Zunongwangia sp. SCSIO 43204]
MKEQKQDFPLDITISFHRVIEQYEDRLKVEENPIAKKYIESLLGYIEKYPKLVEGINNIEDLEKYKDPIKILLDDLFPNVLSNNEIKAVSIPYHNILFNHSNRLKKIIDAAGKDFKPSMREIDDNAAYINACINILNKYYDFNIDFSRPPYYDIPDENGIEKHYRASLNGDFVELYPKEDAKEITQEDVDDLLQNVENIDLWKEKFPPCSWVFKGFVIVNLTDVTVEDAISELKTALLFQKTAQKEELNKLERIFRTIYKIPDLRVGFTGYNVEDRTFEKVTKLKAKSFILNDDLESDCKTGICEQSFNSLIKDNKKFSIPNVEVYARENDNLLARNLLANDVKSCILAPLAKNGNLVGILELVANRKNVLNRINAMKLDEILPYIITASERNKNDFENRVKAVIQSECTSIHPSVLWVFEREARKFISDYDSDGLASFKDIVFKDVYPLYGQIDIVASSDARNEAIQKDLLYQLDVILEIIDKAYKIEELPIYEQVKFRIKEFRVDIDESLNASSEQKIFGLLQREVNPLMEHLEKQSEEIRNMVADYREMLNPETGIIYNHRKDYDDTVQQINRTMSRFLDKRQLEAQKIYPHYFERYKTDGVDHNMYIGPSLTKNKPFNKVYLFNLRLWQIKTMVEMENRFYHLQQSTPMHLDAASLILVYNTTLSIRYRMDEKKFDVDGTYNARYEIIKKRIDKAFIKGTEERITTKGKIVIIYSQKSDEREYVRYVKYLQAKKYLGDELELLELEDVQSVIGLKAIRVNILYTSEQKEHEKPITYENLMEELH